MDSFENKNLSARNIEDKHWRDLTLKEISLIQDLNKRYEYRKNVKHCLMFIINPLYRGIKNKSKFNFSHSEDLLTCRNMLKDLTDYYYKKGYTRDEIINIASENDYKKKY